MLSPVIDRDQVLHVARLARLELSGEEVERMAGGSVQDQLVAAWGLTFKARTDDLRGAMASFVEQGHGKATFRGE